MPKLNRRRFLQVASAAGMVPALPALPAGAIAAPTAVTSSQMLWASLFARAGNVHNAASLTRTMGISNAVAQSLYAKLIETNVLSAYGATKLGATRLGHGVRSAPAVATKVRPAIKTTPSRSSKTDFRRLFSDDPKTSHDKKIDPVENEEPDQLDSPVSGSV